MKEEHEHAPLRLPIFRHLEDYDGCCGPACALMIAKAEGLPHWPVKGPAASR